MEVRQEEWRRRARRMAAGLALALAGAIAMIAAGCGDGAGTATSTATGATPATSAAVRTYRDPLGDVTPGQPDLTAVRISNDARTIRLAFRFASAPPLSANPTKGWTDMLLMGIDVPPIGSKPTPGGWAGLDYALGMHGVDDRAVFRAMQPGFGQQGGTGGAPGVRTLTSRVSGREIQVEVPRGLIGDPAYFEFQAAAGREGADESGTGDLVPGSGTLRYALAEDGS